jgi:hypothetical protein
MLLRFTEEEVISHSMHQSIKTLNLHHAWQVTRSKWSKGWNIRLDMTGGHFAIIARNLSDEEAEDIEAKVIQGIMSKEDGVLQIT